MVKPRMANFKFGGTVGKISTMCLRCWLAPVERYILLSAIPIMAMYSKKTQSTK